MGFEESVRYHRISEHVNWSYPWVLCRLKQVGTSRAYSPLRGIFRLCKTFYNSTYSDHTRWIKPQPVLDDIINSIARSILWRPLLLECSDPLLIQVCLPGLDLYRFPAHSFHLQQTPQSSATNHHHPPSKPSHSRDVVMSKRIYQETDCRSELHRHTSQRARPSNGFHRAQAPKPFFCKRQRLTLPLPRRPSVQSRTKTIIPTATQGHRRVRGHGGAHTYTGRQPEEDGLAARRKPKEDKGYTPSLCERVGQQQSSVSVAPLVLRHDDQHQVQRSALELRNDEAVTRAAAAAAWVSFSATRDVTGTAALELRNEGVEGSAGEL